MKEQYRFTIVIISLILLILACGSSEVVVLTPTGSQSEGQPNPIVPPTQSAPIPTATAQVGTSRNNPAPVGSAILVDDMEFVVTGITRPADSIVSSGNMFNEEPPAGKEYMFITLSVTCKLPSDQQCSFIPYNLKVLGSDGILIDSTSFLAGVDGLLESTTFYGGANVTGNIAFIVNQGDTSVLLVYQPFFGDSFYLSLLQ